MELDEHAMLAVCDAIMDELDRVDEEGPFSIAYGHRARGGIQDVRMDGNFDLDAIARIAISTYLETVEKIR